MRILKWIYKKYPENYIIKNPYIGTLILMVFCFGFVTIYKPLKLHEARFFGYELTMALYCFIFSFPVIGLSKILRRIRYFSKDTEWTILKEIISITLILLEMGIVVYFAGFLMEKPADRWNLSTLFDSCKYTFLIGIVPFAFFTIINYRFLLVTDIVQNYNPGFTTSEEEQPEAMIQIISTLKKEELSFYPSQFFYAESDGNYIVFNLNIDSQIRKRIIRNSISNIEQQLSAIPFFMRTHRAFIVNLKKVRSKKGNTLGYKLKLSDIDYEIPVSRQNTRNFDQIINQFH